MRSRQELEEIYQKMNESERFGVAFGLFPAWVMGHDLENAEIVELMKIRERAT